MVAERRKGLRRDRDKELEYMTADAVTKAEEAISRVSTHEILCAERQGQLLKRMERVEYVIVGTAGFLLACSAIFKLLGG